MYYPDNNCSIPNERPSKNKTSYIRFLHALPNNPPVNVDIYVNKKAIVKNLKYEDFTEYIPARSGVHTIQVYPSGNMVEQLLDIRITTEPDKIYTIAVIGTVDDVEAEAFHDEFMDNKETAYMRFINLAPYDTAFDISIDGIDVVYDLGFTEKTDYLMIPGGKHTMKIYLEPDNKRVVSHPNMMLKNGNIYTSYIVGLEDGNPEIQVLIPLDGSSYIKPHK